jgi:hypothetical protein
VRAILIKRRATQEGEVIPLYQYDLQLGAPGETEGRLFMVWPVIVEHRINEDSPFWDLSADSLQREQFELVVVLEGIVESTGMTTQARTSYLPSEILWGQSFERLVSYQRDNNQYMIDYSRFHSTVVSDIPSCSAKELYELGGTPGDSKTSCSSSDDSSLSGPDDDEHDEGVAAPSLRQDPVLRPGNLAIAGGPGPSADQRRLSISSLMRTNGISGVALAAFDLQPEDDQAYQTMIDCNSVVAASAAAALTDDADAYRFM